MFNACSFIIPVYGNPDPTAECLASLRQWFPRAEVILVDDGSPPAEAQALAGLCSALKVRRVSQSRAGKSVALNRGIGLAGGRYVVACDNDVVFQGRGWLDRHLAILDCDDRIAGVGGWGNPDFLDENACVYHEAGYWGESGFCEMLNGGLVTSRKSLAIEIPRDPKFSYALEDFAWACQVKRAGLGLYLEAAEVEHRMGINVLPGEVYRNREDFRAPLARRYADVLEPRKPREAVRRFMEVGRWS